MTGHSLGGSVASAVGSILDVYVYTYNAPELRHSLAGRQSHADPSKIHHFRLEGDLVSLLGGTVFPQRDGTTLTVPSSNLLSPISAHRLTNLSPELTRDHLKGVHMPLRNEMRTATVVARVPFRVLVESKTIEQTGFEGGFRWTSSNKAVQHIGHIDVLSSSRGKNVLTVDAIRENIHNQYFDRATLTVDSVLNVTETKRGNIFFTATRTEEVVLDAHSKTIIDHRVKTRIDPSMHTSAALQSSRISLVNQLASSLISTGSSLRASVLAKNTTEVMGRSFTASMLFVQLNHHMGTLLKPASK